MEFKEINVLESIVQQIGEEPFADIAVDAGKGNFLYSNANHVLYDNALEEMDMERARYLLNTDEMSEEILKIN
ncbi:MAG: hypothetical protein OIN86_07475 [Candidatus Methanoperedens sp.]|nr:hypothetical protein [Candidatus Methanoperedens sp.]CAG0987490.1 hypothetical protein METP1_02112 [Methanosarcinales archaeon]